ncbi:MAG: glycosyltransferase family 2 protein [Candidatus Aenigmarchaeota archaeon]|nr:glycosyltransferase family 2 protein [Candidatus Aenigmarchaeota archaeon]
MVTISAVVVAKNEEDKIEKCLNHLQWVDEIIIIDNGSTDNTVELCRKYTYNIHSYNKPVLIPFLQNIGIQRATKDWVIIIDADVIVTKEAKEEIIEKINLGTHDGYYLKHVIFFLGKPLRSPYFGEHNIMKLFKRTKGYFKGEYPHEPITFSGKSIGFIDEKLLHYAHPTISTFLKKLDKYTTEEAKKNTKQHNFFQVFGTPILAIFHYFFFRKGYLDGLRGFVYCCMLGLYMFVGRLKTWEIKYYKSTQDTGKR